MRRDALRMHGSLAAIMTSLGGVAHIQDLLDRGYTRYQVAAMGRSGELIRARIGWYVSPTLEPDALRAIRVGGRLGCVSGARSHGLSVPVDRHLHVAVDDHATRLRSSRNGYRNVSAGQDPDVVWHWSGDLGDRGTERYRMSLIRCLDQVVRCVETEWAVGVIDSAVHQRRIDERGMDELRRTPAGRRVLDLVDGRAESILESILRQRLEAASIHAIPQVALPPYRVDFLIDGWLIVEADGAYHGSEVQFASDRSRDSFFARSGKRVLRFTFRQIVDDWPGTLETIRAVLRQGATVQA